MKYFQLFGRQRSWYFNISEDDLIRTGHGNSGEESFDNGNSLFHSSNVDPVVMMKAAMKKIERSVERSSKVMILKQNIQIEYILRT